MKQYIDKSAVVAEIERRKNQFVSQAESFRKIGKKEQESYFAALASNMNSLSCFINTLEVNSTDVFIEKACKWLKENKDHPFIGCEDCCLSGFLTDEFVEEFRKAMKGE